jgi:hypothetical protein
VHHANIPVKGLIRELDKEG